MIRAGVIGGAGYTAGELLRLLVNHPQVEVAFVHSTSNAGNRIADIHGGLEGDTELRFASEYDLTQVDVLFLCSAHGQSRVWLSENDVPAGVRIIDLAQDFRDESEGFVYGLPEMQRCICSRRWPSRPSLEREAPRSCKLYMPQYRGTP